MFHDARGDRRVAGAAYRSAAEQADDDARTHGGHDQRRARVDPFPVECDDAQARHAHHDRHAGRRVATAHGDRRKGTVGSVGAIELDIASAA
jgi:hypothetical protein